jgi:hypothetical protein
MFSVAKIGAKMTAQSLRRKIGTELLAGESFFDRREQKKRPDNELSGQSYSPLDSVSHSCRTAAIIAAHLYRRKSAGKLPAGEKFFRPGRAKKMARPRATNTSVVCSFRERGSRPVFTRGPGARRPFNI